MSRWGRSFVAAFAVFVVVGALLPAIVAAAPARTPASPAVPQADGVGNPPSVELPGTQPLDPVRHSPQALHPGRAFQPMLLGPAAQKLKPADATSKTSQQTKWTRHTVTSHPQGVVPATTPTITVHVTDQTADPLSGIEADFYVGLDEYTGTTVADGTYVFNASGNTAYRICFSDPAGRTYADACYSSSGPVYNVDDATDVVTGTSGNTDVSMSLDYLVSLTGNVANYSALAPSSDVCAWSGGMSACGTIGMYGDYTIRLRPGEWTLSIWVTDWFSVWYSSSGPVYNPADATPVTVGEFGGTQNLTYPTIAHLGGSMTNNFEHPVEIDVYKDGAFCYSDLTHTSSGHAYWGPRPVPPGNYTIGFYDPQKQFSSGWYSATGFTQDPSKAKVITVGTADVTNINATLPYTDYLNGYVLSPSGKTVAYAYVEAFVDGHFYSGAYADDTGFFSVPVLDRSIKVWVFDSYGTYAGGWMSGSTVTADPSKATVTGPTGAYLTYIKMVVAAHIDACVDWADGSGKWGEFSVSAHAFNDASSYGITSGLDCHYSIPIIPGTYTVEAEASYDATEGYAYGWYGTGGYTNDPSKALALAVASGAAKSIGFNLPTGLHISGRVGDKYGAPLNTVGVYAFVNGHYYTGGGTDTDGEYEILVPPGSYTLVFDDTSDSFVSGYYTPTGLVDALADATVIPVSSLDIRMPVVYMSKPTRPTAPRSVTGVGYNLSAGVSWSAPLSIGGRAITGYTVTTVEDNSKTCHTTGALSCTVTGLTNDTPYTFTVTATNIIGTSDPSTASSPVTPIAVPNAPTGVTAVGFNGSATFKWTAPADNGSAITGYTVKSGSKQCTTTTATTCTVIGLTNKTTYTFSVTATNGNGTGPATTVTVQPRVGATYFGITPARVVNTATHVGLTNKLSANLAATFQVGGVGAVLISASAVTGVLCVSGSTSGGWLALTPVPNNAPTTSNLNFPKGDNRCTGVTVPLGATGSLSVTFGGTSVNTNTANITFDVTGYFVVGTSGSTYKTLTPNRILDTRSANGISGKLTAGVAKTFTVINRATGDTAKNVPTSANAVTGTLTVTGQSAAGCITIEPDALNTPPTTSLCFPKGDNRATGLTVKLGTSGKLSVTFTSAAGATTDVLFDVNGYFAAGTSGATYVPVTPNRLVDTRSSVGMSKLTVYVARTFTVINRTSDVTKKIPTGAVAITGTLTVTGQTSGGWLSMNPTAINRPTTSNLNFPKGDNRATGVTVPISSTGTESITYGGAPSRSTTNVIFDVSGYFLN